jgi:hypothetical protein
MRRRAGRGSWARPGDGADLGVGRDDGEKPRPPVVWSRRRAPEAVAVEPTRSLGDAVDSVF